MRRSRIGGHRFLAMFTALSLGLAGGAALTLVANARAGDTAATQLRENKAAAYRDARQLLSGLQTPRDLTRVAAAPHWAIQNAALASAGAISAADRRWWTTASDPQAIIDYIEAHRPAGVAGDGTGSGQDNTTDVRTLTAWFSWPPVGLQLYDRTLIVTVVTPPYGASYVVAQSQSSWIVPRPASELLPRGTRVVDVALRTGRGPEGMVHEHTSTYVVWRPPRVAAIVRQFNALQNVQPDMASCVLMQPREPQLTLTFRAGRGQGQPALAWAQVFVAPGREGSSGQNDCDSFSYWIGSRREPSLTSPTFVGWIGKLIGARIS